MSILLFLHLLGMGIWVGCVLTEIVLELALKHVPPEQSPLARLHVLVDRYVEIPAIILVATTGVLMLQSTSWDSLLMIKVGLGVAAVLLNSAAAWCVHQRYSSLQHTTMSGYHFWDQWHERIGVGCVTSLLGAIAVGGYRLVT